jgi:hypothetical protein
MHTMEPVTSGQIKLAASILKPTSGVSGTACHLHGAGAEPVQGLLEGLMRSPAHHLFYVFVPLLLCGCDQHDPAKQRSELEQQGGSESELLADPTKARPELTRRLRLAVSMHEGFIAVKSPFGQGMAILPASAPWFVTCGETNISVHFGGAVAANDSGVSIDPLNVPLVLFADTPISTQTCTELGTALAKEIQAIIDGK